MIRIDTRHDLEAAAALLGARDQTMADVVAQVSPLPLRRRPNGYSTLLNIIVGQLVSTSAASAIWQRLEASGLVTEAAVLSAGEDTLLSCGLSRPKAGYAMALAEGHLDWKGLEGRGTEDVISDLMALPGIGRWTAEVYALTALGHADVFPAGDLALREAVRMLTGAGTRPTETETRRLAAKWSPVRAVAARALWAYYRQQKDRDGII